MQVNSSGSYTQAPDFGKKTRPTSDGGSAFKVMTSEIWITWVRGVDASVSLNCVSLRLSRGSGFRGPQFLLNLLLEGVAVKNLPQNGMWFSEIPRLNLTVAVGLSPLRLNLVKAG